MIKKIFLLLLFIALLFGCNEITEEQAQKVKITYTVSEENPSGNTVVDVVFNIENVYNADITAVKFKSTIIFADQSTDVNSMLLDKVIKIGASNSELTLHKEYNYSTNVDRVKIEDIVAEVKNRGQL